MHTHTARIDKIKTKGRATGRGAERHTHRRESGDAAVRIAADGSPINTEGGGTAGARAHAFISELDSLWARERGLAGTGAVAGPDRLQFEILCAGRKGVRFASNLSTDGGGAAIHEKRQASGRKGQVLIFRGGCRAPPFGRRAVGCIEIDGLGHGILETKRDTAAVASREGISRHAVVRSAVIQSAAASDNRPVAARSRSAERYRARITGENRMVRQVGGECYGGRRTGQPAAAVTEREVIHSRTRATDGHVALDHANGGREIIDSELVDQTIGGLRRVTELEVSAAVVADIERPQRTVQCAVRRVGGGCDLNAVHINREHRGTGTQRPTDAKMFPGASRDTRRARLRQRDRAWRGGVVGDHEPQAGVVVAREIKIAATRGGGIEEHNVRAAPRLRALVPKIDGPVRTNARG